MKKLVYLDALSVILAFAVSLFYYPKLPDRLPSHWNAQGDVDGYASKNVNLFMIPVIMIVLLGVFYSIPKIDPKRRNWSSFMDYYHVFVFGFIMYLLSFHFILIAWSNGVQIDINIFISVALGLLYVLTGLFMFRVKQNWFAGIRTPWTMSDVVVWDKTHQLGGGLFIVSGIIALLGVFFRSLVIWLVLIPILLSTVISTVYSYVLYKKRYPHMV